MQTANLYLHAHLLGQAAAWTRMAQRLLEAEAQKAPHLASTVAGSIADASRTATVLETLAASTTPLLILATMHPLEMALARDGQDLAVRLAGPNGSLNEAYASDDWTPESIAQAITETAARAGRPIVEPAELGAVAAVVELLSEARP